MKAILMAAGRGTRISRNVQKPKCTLEVKDTTIVAHTVDLLKKNNIDVAIVVGYRHNDVREALKDYDVTFYYNPYYAVTNSLGSLWFAREFLEAGEDVIMINADTYFEQPLLDVLLADDHKYMMLGDKSRVEKGDYFFNVKDDYLEKYGKELTREERNCEYVGFAKVLGSSTQEFLNHLNQMVEEGRYDLWWENVLYEFIGQVPVYVQDVSDLFWAEVDYIDDYNRIQNYIDGNGWK